MRELGRTISPVPSGFKQGWRMELSDGSIVSPPPYFRLFNEYLNAQLEYGLTPSGAYDQPVISEPLGAVAVVPIVVMSPRLVLVGCVNQRRPLAGPDYELQTVMGVAEPSISLAESASQEMEEEAGIPIDPTEMIALPLGSDRGVNCNASYWRTYYEGWDPSQAGIFTFTVQLQPEGLVYRNDEWVPVEMTARSKKSLANEQIERCVFVPFDLAVLAQSSSGISHSAWLQAYAYWHELGVL